MGVVIRTPPVTSKLDPAAVGPAGSLSQRGDLEAAHADHAVGQLARSGQAEALEADRSDRSSTPGTAIAAATTVLRYTGWAKVSSSGWKKPRAPARQVAGGEPVEQRLLPRRRRGGLAATHTVSAMSSGT